MKAYQWLKENRHRFKRKIHGPLVLQIQLKDERYANLVESLLGGRYSTNLRAFVCETQEDYDLFTKEVVDNLNLRLTVSWPDKINQDRVKPMMSREDLQRNFGMDCFLSELLEGPKILIDYLCSETRINLVPLTLKNADERLLADSGKFRRFGIQDNLYEVKTYSYGRGGNQVQVRKCWVSDYLKNKVDTQAMSKVKDEIHSLTESKKELYMEAETIQNDYNKKRQRLTELRHEKDDKRQQKKDIIFQKQRWEKEKQKIESYEYQLEGLRNAPQDDNEMMDRYKDQLANQITRRAHLAGIYTDHLKNSTKCVLDRNVAQLELMQAKAKQNFVEDFSRRQSTALGQAEQGFRQAQAESRQKKAIAQRFQRDAEAAGRDLDDEQKEEFNAIKEKWHEEGLGQTVIELEDAIQAEKAKAETLKASNPNAMAQYEQRLGKIQMYQRKIDSEKQELDGIREKIEQVKSRWEPQLISLVGRISVSFGAALQRIGCAGEVCVAKEEDFEKWGIEIRVKFRDNEKLQLLTGQRQSGGERAVSTILYLMSLQNLAKSPFRVVDEINQGMDPRNERMIHEQIVKGASKPGTAQYFLITPKLLPDLFYNERMRVLCIYNGEWQPKRLKPIAEYLRHARSSASSSSRPISSASS
ncbi:P-loop containing nucleoside triphosphate hydrolase protein [Phascolomyces articulosus]|uniref:Structural maintenance of chromosomes protein 5 n=1 Tax=Phascolomyces articulosus TaxID=60185 RepID=A0AAD5K6B1_9FUNG|nr:P-loop containing nucleoside triphosphate hydrolase protein [Phascolomyces articulosus]